MSDDFMLEDDDQDYDFDDEDNDEPEFDLENKYYNAKARKEDDPIEALVEFQSVMDSEEEKGEWGFKALKQMAKISFGLNKRDDMLSYYQQLLTYTKKAVTRNYAEKSINNILDYASAVDDTAFVEKLYEITLKSLEETSNQRLWVKTNLKLAKLWLDHKKYDRLREILKQLYDVCRQTDANDDQAKGTQLVEVLALEIQMCMVTGNSKRLKELYHECLQVKSAIPHPRIMGVIRECGGKMHMTEKQWDKAQSDFFESFKNYDEAGSRQRIQVLKYYVLANMLTESQINPFDSPETKPYKNDKEIVAMTDLVSAYQRQDIGEFEHTLQAQRQSIMSDPFIRSFIDDVLTKIRTQALLRMVRPYTKIRLDSIAEQLNIPNDQAESLLIALILDEKIPGKIDQIHGTLELDPRSTDATKDEALRTWSTNVSRLCSSVFSKAI